MKILICLFTLFFLNIFWAQDGTSIKSKKKKKDKQATGWNYNGEFEKFEVVEQETAPGMVFIEGGLLRGMQLPMNLNFSKSDSLINKTRINSTGYTISSFYISENEVTNKEYREFVEWVKIRMAMDLLAANYPSKRLSNGNYNEEIEIDWKDPVLEKFYSPNGNYKGNTKELRIYPDTLCWLREYDLNTLKRYKHSIYENGEIIRPSEITDLKLLKIYFEKEIDGKSNDFIFYQKIDSMLNYFSDPKYNDYPVVGVTWNQANAYCQWRSDRVNENILLRERILEKKSYYFTTESYLNTESTYNGRKVRYEDGILLPNFHLPTNAEWQFAAVYLDDSSNVNHYYPWGSNEVRDKKGKYQANFGRILDQNGLIIKTMAEDGFLFTAPVGSFKPNQTGLNDMVGNVSEWVMDVSRISDWQSNSSYSFTEIKKNNPKRAFTLAFEELNEQGLVMDSTCKSNVDFINEYLNERIQFEEVNKNNQIARVVKGGSWADGSLYLMPSVDTFFKEDSASARIGFRVAMDRVGSPSRKNHKRKNKRIR